MATAFTLADLKSEINNDPLTVGYGTPKNKGQMQTVADLINARSGAGSAVNLRNDLKAHEVTENILAADFAAMTDSNIQKLMLLFGTQGTIDATNVNNQANFGAQIPAGSQAAIFAVASRVFSRAEMLWGQDTLISSQQVQESLALA